MAFLLSNLEIDEVSLCKKGANQGAKVALFKSMDKELEQMPKVEKLMTLEVGMELKKEDIEKIETQFASFTKQFEELEEKLTKAAHANSELEEKVKNKNKDKEEKPTLEKKLEEVDPEVQKHIDEIRKSAETAQAEVKKTADTLAEMQKDMLKKEIMDRLEKSPRSADTDEVRETLCKSLMDVSEDHRNSMFEIIEKAELLAGKSESLFEEIGRHNAPSTGDATQEVIKRAEELVKQDPTINATVARDTIRKADTVLAERERVENKVSNK